MPNTNKAGLTAGEGAAGATAGAGSAAVPSSPGAAERIDATLGAAGGLRRENVVFCGRFCVLRDDVPQDGLPPAEKYEYISASALARIPAECRGPLLAAPLVAGDGSPGDRVKLLHMSSMQWWWPRLAAACARSPGELAAPETALVRFAPGDGGWEMLLEYHALDTWTEPAWWPPLVELVSREAMRLGFPALLRGEFVGGGDTGQGVVRRLADVPARIVHLVGRHLSAMSLAPTLECFAVRRWLDAEKGAELVGCRAFRAFGPEEEGGPGEPLVVGREARVVVEDGRVVSADPYWHPDWLRGEHATPDAADWEERLARLNDWPAAALAALVGAARLAGAALADSGVAWVVEFLWAADQSGAARWWAVDAQPAGLAPAFAPWEPAMPEETEGGGA